MAIERKLPINGTLFASGAGKIPELRPRFLASLGEPDARILTIPSTNDLVQNEDVQYGWPTIPEFKDGGVFELDIGDEEFLKKWNWSVHWFHQMKVPNAAVLYTTDREVANSEEFCAHIRNAKGIFFTTGTASKAIATYKDTKAHEEFMALLDRDGSIGGWSGGAAIQGSWSADTEVDPFIETLGFLPNTAIMTHFLVWNTQFYMPKVVEEHPECLGIGLDEKAAIAVHGDELEVIGSSYVAIYDYNKVLLPDGKFYLIAPGDRLNLTTREVVGEPKTYLRQLVNQKWNELEPTQNQPAIIGTWKLVSFEIQQSNGEVVYPFGEEAQGCLIYTESGYVSAQVMRPDRPQFTSGDQMQGTPIEIETNYKGVVSYYGPYEFDAENGFIIHHVERSLFPNWEGQSQKRFFELSENRLKLSTPPTLWGGGEMIAVLLWQRVD